MSEWIKWGGGDCPVDEGVPVDVRFECGEESDADDATDFRWSRSDNPWDIVAYRLREQPQAMMKAESFLNQAAKHMADRAATYDKPEGERSISQVVAIFNLYHGTNLTEAQGWHFMEIVKNVRFFTANGFHRDSGEDAIAYSALKAEAKQKEGK